MYTTKWLLISIVFVVILMVISKLINDYKKNKDKDSKSNILLRNLKKVSELKTPKDERLEALISLSKNLHSDFNEDDIDGEYFFGHSDIYEKIESETKKLDFSGLYREKLHLMDIDLTGSNFSKTTFDESRFFNCIFNDIDFSYTSLKNSMFKKVDISSADFRLADLRESWLEDINFGSSNLLNANFSYTNLKGANLKNTILRISDLNAIDQMEYFEYDNLDMVKTIFIKAIYDSDTVFPEWFNPNDFNMIKNDKKIDIDTWFND